MQTKVSSKIERRVYVTAQQAAAKAVNLSNSKWTPAQRQERLTQIAERRRQGNSLARPNKRLNLSDPSTGGAGAGRQFRGTATQRDGGITH